MASHSDGPELLRYIGGKPLACPHCYWEWRSRMFRDWVDQDRIDRCPHCGADAKLSEWAATADAIGATGDGSGGNVRDLVDVSDRGADRGIYLDRAGLDGPLAASGQPDRPGGLLRAGRGRLAKIARENKQAVIETAMVWGIVTAFTVWLWLT